MKYKKIPFLSYFRHLDTFVLIQISTGIVFLVVVVHIWSKKEWYLTPIIVYGGWFMEFHYCPGYAVFLIFYLLGHCFG